MRLIVQKDIEDFAGVFVSKGYFPLLICKLVRATTPQSTFAEFPSGTAAFVSGWDGIVKCDEKREYVPLGTSLWEFGTTESNNKKAEDDYKKRTANPLGYNPKDCIFIFATPTFWKDKDKWRQKKLKDGIWKDVLVYDSRNLEEWLDLSGAGVVARWFSSFINKYPADGIQMPQEFLDIWCSGPTKLLPEMITSGRENESQQILDFLTAAHSIKGVRGSSKEEAMAFIIATAIQSTDPKQQENFFSKALIIETDANLRSICVNQKGLIIISKTEDINTIYYGASKGHHILVPLGPDDTFPSKDIIDLPSVNGKALKDGLMKMGYSEEQATNYVKESAKNIVILKRLLDFPQDKIEWATRENAREIIPALLLGRWDESKQGDKDALEKLSGEKYDDYILKISKWRDSAVPLFLQIGTSWRLTSPMDAWTNLSAYITKVDLEILRATFLDVLKIKNPKLDIAPESRYFAALMDVQTTHSNWAREGLIQSLILIGLYGNSFKIPQISSSQAWVDETIKLLLADANGKLWASLNYEMPLIAEASPNSFMNAVATALKEVDTPIKQMFEEEASIVSNTSHHTGLLWALEELCWIPEYISDAALLLAKLSAIDPGGTLSNRPINSLVYVFKPWHFQTLASFDERVDVLKLIAKNEKKVAWTLLSRLLPSHNDVGHYSHKMRWRMFAQSVIENYDGREVPKMHTAIVQILLSIFEPSEEKMAELIKDSVEMKESDRKIVLDFVESKYDTITPVKYYAWSALREILYWQNSHPDSHYYIGKKELVRYEELYNQKEPKEEIQKSIWLFNDHWPKFPEGYVHKSGETDKQYELIRQRRVAALSKIYNDFGIDKVKGLSTEVTERYWLGDTLAYILTDENDIISICEFLNNEGENLSFIYGFFFRRSIIEGLDWVISLFNRLKAKGYSDVALARLFIPVNPSMKLWSFITAAGSEIEKVYWLNMNPNLYIISPDEKTYEMNKLIEYKRFLSALKACTYSLTDISTKTILELLEKIATEQPEEDRQLQGHEIGLLFEELDKRNDVDAKALFQMEWFFVPILASYGTLRKPKLLYGELAKNPDFFIQVLKLMYITKDEELNKKEREGISETLLYQRAKMAYDLLSTWKDIPGVDETGILNEEKLKEWVKAVREKADEVKRLEVADMTIGKILAQYPEADKNWPVEAIFNIIEEINTESIKNNFSAALFNKRGSSTRGAFDGGDIERGHANYFSELANRYKNKYPTVAKIFRDLSTNYLADAKQMDNRAKKDKLDYL